MTTNSNHQRPIYDNVLQRQFTVDQPNKAYVSDITYVWPQEGWLYLTVMMDLFSRKIVGWHMGSRMTADTVCMALNMAIGLRNPMKGLIVHSDRGSQYASQKYQSLLANHGFIGSMSCKGDCWDNSVAESFFSRLKNERLFWRNYQTRDEAKKDILNYILMFYNSQRLHSKLGYVSPQQFENNYWGVRTKAAQLQCPDLLDHLKSYDENLRSLVPGPIRIHEIIYGKFDQTTILLAILLV